MISDPKQIHYACIAKGHTILAEFTQSRDDPTLLSIARQCVEKMPPNHSMFTHTVRNRTYTFLIENPFSCFVIFDESLEKLESFSYLYRLRSAFDALLGSVSSWDLEKVSPLCLQDRFGDVFTEIIASDSGLVDCIENVGRESRNPSVGSSDGPLLSKPGNVLMKKNKKRVSGAGGDDGVCMMNSNDYHGNTGDSWKDLRRDVSVSSDGKQKAKQIWRQHVWVVLMMDLFVCAVLFGVWLWVCRGFKCMDG